MKGRRKGGGGRANKILPDYREGDNGMREWRYATGKQREEKRGEKHKLFVERRAREASSKVLRVERKCSGTKKPSLRSYRFCCRNRRPFFSPPLSRAEHKSFRGRRSELGGYKTSKRIQAVWRTLLPFFTESSFARDARNILPVLRLTFLPLAQKFPSYHPPFSFQRLY